MSSTRFSVDAWHYSLRPKKRHKPNSISSYGAFSASGRNAVTDAAAPLQPQAAPFVAFPLLGAESVAAPTDDDHVHAVGHVPIDEANPPVIAAVVPSPPDDSIAPSRAQAAPPLVVFPAEPVADEDNVDAVGHVPIEPNPAIVAAVSPVPLLHDAIAPLPPQPCICVPQFSELLWIK